VRKFSTVTLDGKEYEVDRARLRRWLQLEDIREKTLEATDRKDRSGFIASIYSYLSVAFSVEIDFSILPWYEVVDAYADLTHLNSPSIELPFLLTQVPKEEIPWSYEGRTWYLWSHLLAESYGWSLEYIAEMDIDDALALIQEIKTSDQLEKEWDWLLSDRAVSYNKQGKAKSVDYPRPDWMTGRFAPLVPEKTKIKKSMLPVGNVLKWNNSDGSLDA